MQAQTKNKHTMDDRKYRQMLEIIKICREKDYTNETKKYYTTRIDTDRAQACRLLQQYEKIYCEDLRISFQVKLEDLFAETTDMKDLEIPMRNLCEFNTTRYRNNK